jgi:hypothetical protein
LKKFADKRMAVGDAMLSNEGRRDSLRRVMGGIVLRLQGKSGAHKRSAEMKEVERRQDKRGREGEARRATNCALLSTST